MEDSNYSNFILVRGKPNGIAAPQAFVYPDDKHKRIFFVAPLIANASIVTLSMSMLHEVSHFLGTTDFLTVGSKFPDTKLYFPPHPLDQSVEGYVESLEEHANYLKEIKQPGDLMNNADSLSAFALHFAIRNSSDFGSALDEL